MATEMVYQLYQLASTWEDDIITTVWTSIWTSARPHAMSLRDIITMPLSNSPNSLNSPTPTPTPLLDDVVPQNSQPVPPIPSPSHVRHGACTHTRMERLYGPFLCSWCHRPSTLGWVYSCLQNDEDYLFDDETMDKNSVIPSDVPIAEQHHDGQLTNGFNNQATNAQCANNEYASIQPSILQLTKALPAGHNDELSSPIATIEEMTVQTNPVHITEGIGTHSIFEGQASVGFTNTSSNQHAGDVNEQAEPEVEFSISHPHPRLSAGIENAIKEGHYNSEQVVKMRAQRQKVLDVINAAKKNMNLYLENDVDPPRKFAISPSIEANSYLPFPVINEVQEIPKGRDELVTKPSRPRMYPRCMHRACHNCRPTYIDRAWVRLDGVLTMEAPIPSIDLEFDNRPISDVGALRNIGLLQPISSRTRPHFRRNGFFASEKHPVVSPMSLPRQLPIGFLAFNDLADQDLELESRGFRESMRRAFRGMLSRRRDSLPARSSRMRRSKDLPVVTFDMALWRELNDELLQEASNIPLPGHDSMDGLGDDESEVEVEGGVAVTEEGIDLGTADVIMLF